MSRTRTGAPPRTIELQLNGETVEAREGMTILEVAQREGIEIPTMCWERTLSEIALLVIRARERWRELKGVGG